MKKLVILVVFLFSFVVPVSFAEDSRVAPGEAPGDPPEAPGEEPGVDEAPRCQVALSAAKDHGRTHIYTSELLSVTVNGDVLVEEGGGIPPKRFFAKNGDKIRIIARDGGNFHRDRRVSSIYMHYESYDREKGKTVWNSSKVSDKVFQKFKDKEEWSKAPKEIFDKTYTVSELEADCGCEVGHVTHAGFVTGWYGTKYGKICSYCRGYFSVNDRCDKAKVSGIFRINGKSGLILKDEKPTCDVFDSGRVECYHYNFNRKDLNDEDITCGFTPTYGGVAVAGNARVSDAEKYDYMEDMDGDGKSDCVDPRCLGQKNKELCGEDKKYLCQDKVDNDEDGLVDCEEESCWK